MPVQDIKKIAQVILNYVRPSQCIGFQLKIDVRCLTEQTIQKSVSLAQQKDLIIVYFE
jgi:hypothetical protein